MCSREFHDTFNQHLCIYRMQVKAPMRGHESAFQVMYFPLGAEIG